MHERPKQESATLQELLENLLNGRQTSRSRSLYRNHPTIRLSVQLQASSHLHLLLVAQFPEVTTIPPKGSRERAYWLQKPLGRRLCITTYCIFQISMTSSTNLRQAIDEVEGFVEKGLMESGLTYPSPRVLSVTSLSPSWRSCRASSSAVLYLEEQALLGRQPPFGILRTPTEKRSKYSSEQPDLRLRHRRAREESGTPRSRPPFMFVSRVSSPGWARRN